MTSPDRIAANRGNAARSTGPRTAAGKRKVATNALRHGLRASIDADPETSGVVARIAAVLAGPDASPHLRALIRPIAEAQADMLRIRSTRTKLIDLGAAANAGEGETDPIVSSLATLVRLDRYERSAMRRRQVALRELRKSYTRLSK
ncbi:MAG: hypothetical protein JO328_12975 [Hyphomicrobiales bacterium]|nr:hypothetical protein [Hyphomicrobiales bacterium]MBV8826162.1 hypothetical protein [Hyphomicrobiales bacterium]